MRQVLVWDIATRLFHWLLVLFVVVCFLTGEDEGFIFAVHAYAGFAVLMLLAFRLGWGVFGSRHSRFSDFIYPWSTVWRYAASILRLKPERHLGHNPLGGLMVFAMLAVLMAVTLSGLLIVTEGAGWLDDIHESLGTLMQIMVLVHIAGVFADRLLTGDKLVKAMITGYKDLAADAAQLETQTAGFGRMLIFATLVSLGGAYLFQQTDYSAKVAAFAADDDDDYKRKYRGKRKRDDD